MYPKHTWVTYLESCLAALWVRIEQAEAEGDEYHVDLWLRLVERREEGIRLAKIREEAR